MFAKKLLVPSSFLHTKFKLCLQRFQTGPVPVLRLFRRDGLMVRLSSFAQQVHDPGAADEGVYLCISALDSDAERRSGRYVNGLADIQVCRIAAIVQCERHATVCHLECMMDVVEGERFGYGATSKFFVPRRTLDTADREPVVRLRGCYQRTGDNAT